VPETSAPKTSDFVDQDFGKLRTVVEKPEIEVRAFDPHADIRISERGDLTLPPNFIRL
jgi:hypothetical protein